MKHLRAVPSPDEHPIEASDELSDEQLAEAVAQGDARQAGVLYDRVIDSVQRSLVRVLGRRTEEHDDLVQIAFEQIVTSLTRRKFAATSRLSTWASAVATHVALNAIRTRRRDRGRQSVPLEDETVAIGDLRRDLELKQEVDRVRRHLGELDADKAEALILHDVLGHDLVEIAAITSVSVAAAQSRLVRGRKELVLRMEKEAPR